MLYKNVVQFFGRSLSGAFIKPQEDMVFCAGDMEAIGHFRQSAIDDISGAKVFLLDGEAANYVDSFREELGSDEDTYVRAVVKFISETEMPHELVWVEYDHCMLLNDRLKRGHKMEGDYSPEEFGQRGFLIDNRSSEVVSEIWASR